MKKTSPVEQVELHPSKQRSYNEEHCILSSENTIIERLQAVLVLQKVAV